MILLEFSCLTFDFLFFSLLKRIIKALLNEKGSGICIVAYDVQTISDYYSSLVV